MALLVPASRLAGFAGGGPAEAAFFEAFRRYPKTGAVEVEELDAVAAFVGEDEEGVAGGGGLELVGSEGVKAVEGFAHVAGIEREEDFEGGAGEVQHGWPPFAARCLRKVAMNSVASGIAAWSSSRSERPWLNSMTRRGRSVRGKSTSTNRTSVQVGRRDGAGRGLDIRAGGCTVSGGLVGGGF